MQGIANICSAWLLDIVISTCFLCLSNFFIATVISQNTHIKGWVVNGVEQVMKVGGQSEAGYTDCLKYL